MGAWQRIRWLGQALAAAREHLPLSAHTLSFPCWPAHAARYLCRSGKRHRLHRAWNDLLGKAGKWHCFQDSACTILLGMAGMSTAPAGRIQILQDNLRTRSWDQKKAPGTSSFRCHVVRSGHGQCHHLGMCPVLSTHCLSCWNGKFNCLKPRFANAYHNMSSIISCIINGKTIVLVWPTSNYKIVQRYMYKLRPFMSFHGCETNPWPWLSHSHWHSPGAQGTDRNWATSQCSWRRRWQPLPGRTPPNTRSNRRTYVLSGAEHLRSKKSTCARKKPFFPSWFRILHQRFNAIKSFELI